MDKLKPQDRDLLEEALAVAQRLGINAQIEQWQPKINGGHADAWIVLQLGGKKVRYTAEVKRGLRPVTLGAVIQQLQRLGERPLLNSPILRVITGLPSLMPPAMPILIIHPYSCG